MSCVTRRAACCLSGERVVEVPDFRRRQSLRLAFHRGTCGRDAAGAEALSKCLSILSLYLVNVRRSLMRICAGDLGGAVDLDGPGCVLSPLHTHPHTHTHTRTRMHARTHARTLLSLSLLSLSLSLLSLSLSLYLSPYLRTYVRTYIHTYIHIPGRTRWGATS